MNNHVKSVKRPSLEVDEITLSMRVGEKDVSFERETGKEKRRLIFSPEDCTGCGMCYKACPVEAISPGPSGVILKGLADAPHMVLSPEKCTLCGICAAVCLFNAIDVERDGRSIKDFADYSQFKKLYSFDQKRCKPKDGKLCKDCEEACQRGAIRAKLQGKKNTIERNSNLCIYCSSCERACPQDAISVRKIFDGTIEVDLDKCQGCAVCFEICPSGSITHPKPEKPGDRPNKIEIDTDICAFCGACEFVCPVDAITIKRKKMKYIKSKGKSWTKTWEKAFSDMVSKEEVKK